MKRGVQRAAFCLLAAVMLLSACQPAGESAADGGQTNVDRPSQEAMDWRSQYDLGIRLLNEGNYEEAILAFTAAIEIDAKRPQTYMGRGDAYVAIAQEEMVGMEENAQLTADASAAYQNAAADYVTVTELDSGIAEAYEKAAQTYVALGDIEAAIAILEQGVEETGDEGLAEYLEKLRNRDQVTVVGHVIFNPDEYREQWGNYIEIYQPENNETHCSIGMFGVRFDSPLECVFNGETVMIEETVLGWVGEELEAQLYNYGTQTVGPLVNQTMEMTGIIVESGREEIEEERDENGQFLGYYYNPNGKYAFDIESYTVLSE